MGFGDEIIECEPEILMAIAEFANGDARTALSTLEMAVLNGDSVKDKIIIRTDYNGKGLKG